MPSVVGRRRSYVELLVPTSERLVLESLTGLLLVTGFCSPKSRRGCPESEAEEVLREGTTLVSGESRDLY
jgi:hypothetical protein